MISGVPGTWEDTRRHYPPPHWVRDLRCSWHTPRRGSLSRADRWKEDVDNECVLATLEIIRSATTRVQMGAGPARFIACSFHGPLLPPSQPARGEEDKEEIIDQRTWENIRCVTTFTSLDAGPRGELRSSVHSSFWDPLYPSNPILPYNSK